jgi:hypothetical protein
MSAIATLKAVLGLDSGPFKAGTRDAEGYAKRFGTTLSSVGRTLGFAFSAAAVISMGRAFVKWAGDLSEAAQNLGILTSDMMAFNAVALQGGLDIDQMQRLLAKLKNNVYDAAKGSETANKAFEAMGLSARDLAGLSLDEQLKAVAKAAFATGTPLTILTELFGVRVGPKAVAVLRDIAENGLPAVDEAAGRTADAVERMTDRINSGLESSRQSLLKYVALWGEGIDVIQDFFAGAVKMGEYPDIEGGIDKAVKGYGKRRKIEERDAQNRKVAKEAEATEIVKVFEKTKADKEAKIRADFEKKAASVRDQFGAPGEQSIGAARGSSFDQYAKVGGMIGSARSGLGGVDSQMKRQIQIAQRLEALNKEMLDQLKDLNDKAARGA